MTHCSLHERLIKGAMRKGTAVIVTLLTAAVLGTAMLQYKQRTRVIEGTWLYMFEGSDFFEKRLPGRECELYRSAAAWLNYNPSQIYPGYKYDRVWPSSGMVESREYGQYRVEAFEVKFLGRQRFSLLGTGHMGGWSSEYEVDEMLAVKPIPRLRCSAP